MFDIGFIELLVVFVVGLVVIGPDKLPETIRSITMFTSRIKRSIAVAKAEIEREVGADDIRRQIHNHEVMTQLNESKEAIENTFKEGMPPPTADQLDPITGEIKAIKESIGDNSQAQSDPKKADSAPKKADPES